jgi:hypothetical protein
LYIAKVANPSTEEFMNLGLLESQQVKPISRLVRAAVFLPVLSILFLSSRVLAVGSITLAGRINRSTDTSFTLTVTVKGTSLGTKLGATEKDLTKDRLKIAISKFGDEFVAYDGTNPTANMPFTFVKTADPSQSDGGSNLYDLVFKVKISQSESEKLSSAMESDGTGKYVRVKVKYYEDGKAQTDQFTEEKMRVSNAIVKNAPTGLSVSGTHKALKVNWTAESTTTYNDNTTSNIEGIVVVAIDLNANDAVKTDLPARAWDSTGQAAEDPEATGVCKMTSPDKDRSTNGSISCTDSSKHYLDTKELEGMTGQLVFAKTFDSSKGSGIITELENGHQYGVFAYFAPGGLDRTAVLLGEPVENKTGAEIAGEGDAKWENPRCFIATAAFGTPFHKNIHRFTWFRDRWLMTNMAGRSFVNFYYEYGPKVAALIKDRPVLRAGTRALLWPAAVSIALFGSSNEPVSQREWLSLFAIAVVVLGAFTGLRFYRKIKI